MDRTCKPKSSKEILFLYIVFAAISTLANIGTQALYLWAIPGANQIVASILMGTAIGLVIKYILDKKYIFNYQTKSLSSETEAFTLYSLCGVVTTALFWGTEWLFHLLYESDGMRYVGAVIGLSAGYWLKYRLDKKFVFRSER